MMRGRKIEDRRIELERDLRQLEGDMVRHASRMKEDAIGLARPGNVMKRYPVQTIAAGLAAGALLAWGIHRWVRGGSDRMDAADGASATIPGGQEDVVHKAPSMREALRSEIRRAIARQAAQFLTTSFRDAIHKGDGERQPS